MPSFKVVLADQVVLIVLLFGLLTGFAQAQEAIPPLEEIRAHAEQHRQELAKLAETVRQNPEDRRLWSQWFTQRTILQNFESLLQGEDRRTMDPAVLERRQKELLGTWFDSWQAEFPNSGTLALLRHSMSATTSEILPGLVELSTRFPNHLEIANRLVRAQMSRGSLAEATAVAETFLAQNPENPGAYRLVQRLYDRAGKTQDVAELAEAWTLAHPEDPDAHRLWWQHHAETLDPDTRLQRARQISNQLRGEDKAKWCQQVGRSLTHVALECYGDALTQIDEKAPAYIQSLTAYTNLLRDTGDPAAFESAFAGLPTDRQEFIRGQIAHDLISNIRCDEALTVIRGSATPTAVLAAAARRLPNCLDAPTFRETTLDAIRRGTPNQANRILAQADSSWPVEPLETLIDSWDEVSTEDRLKTLEILYQATGATEKRIALLENRLRDESDLPKRSAQDLAELYLQQGEPTKAISALEYYARNHRRPPQFETMEQLATLYVATKQPEKAIEWGQHLVAKTGTQRGLGALLLARLAFSRGSLEEARDFYEIFFEETPVTYWEKAAGYPELLLSLGDAASVKRHFNREWQALNEEQVGSGMSRDEWMGDQLKAWSFEAEALSFYEQAIAAVGGSKALLVKAARLAEELEVWDRARGLRQEILKRAPNDPKSWGQLAQHHLDRNQVQTAFGVLGEAFDQLAKPDPHLWNLWADAILATEPQNSALNPSVLKDAIEVLQQTIEAFDDREYSRALLNHRLIGLYDHLGLEPPKELPTS